MHILWNSDKNTRSGLNWVLVLNANQWISYWLSLFFTSFLSRIVTPAINPAAIACRWILRIRLNLIGLFFLSFLFVLISDDSWFDDCKTVLNLKYYVTLFIPNCSMSEFPLWYGTLNSRGRTRTWSIFMNKFGIGDRTLYLRYNLVGKRGIILY